MKKIFIEQDRFDPVTYSESYEVKYTAPNEEGFWRSKSMIFFAASKNAHKQVAAKFKQLMQGKEFTLVGVTYQ